MSFFVNLPLDKNQTYLFYEYKYIGKDYPYHYHEDYELTLVMKSYGMRFIGDSIKPYDPGDLVLIGPNLAHQWKKDEKFKTPGGAEEHIFVLQFRADFLGRDFLARSEVKQIKDLLDRSKPGIAFGKAPSRKVVPYMEAFRNCSQLDAIVNLIRIMQILSESEEHEFLASPGYMEAFDEKGRDKITRIIRYVLDNFDQDITASMVADFAGMKLSAFSHYFKFRTTKPFVRFLNEVRLGHASKLLTESDYNVSEICYRSGFRNLSNFNRQFKEYYDCSPLQYKKNFLTMNLNKTIW